MLMLIRLAESEGQVLVHRIVSFVTGHQIGTHLLVSEKFDVVDVIDECRLIVQFDKQTQVTGFVKSFFGYNMNETTVATRRW